MKFMTAIWTVLFLMAGTSVVLAADNQSAAPVSVGYYDPNAVQTWDETRVERDTTGTAGIYRDLIIMDTVRQLATTVKSLAQNCGPAAKPGTCEKAVGDAGKDAGKTKPLPPRLNWRQKKQVEAMMKTRDEAIVAAGTGDQVGLAAAVRVLQGQMAALQANDDKQDKAIADNTNAIAALTTRIDALQASDATDSKVDEKLETLKSELLTKGGEVKIELENKIEKIEKLVARVEKALEDGDDSAEIDALRFRMEQVASSTDEASRTAKAADEKSDKALAKAEEALALANQKMDAGLLEVGFEGFFSPTIKAGLVEGAYVITKWRLRLALGGAIGGTFESPDDTKFVFDTRLRLYFAISPEHFWLGGFASMYGEGLPTNDQFGYGGGAVVRGMLPLGGSGFSLGLEGFIGGASEYSWVDNTSGLANAADGEIVDEHVLEPNPVVFGGFNIILTR